MKKKRFKKESSLLIAIIAFLLFAIVGSYSIISYSYQKESSLKQFDRISSRIASSLETKLKNIDYTFSTYFMNEEFQEAIIEREDNEKESNSTISKMINLLISSNISDIKGAGFIPVINDNYSTSDIIYDGYDSILVNYNLNKIIDKAKEDNYQRGGLFFLKLKFYFDNSDTDYFVFARNIMSIQNASFNKKLGLGFIYINKSLLLDILQKVEESNAIWAEIICNEESIYNSSSLADFNKFNNSRYYQKTITLDFLEWKLRSYFDSYSILNELLSMYLIISIVIIISIICFLIAYSRIRKKNQISLDYLFDCFSEIKENTSLVEIELIGDKGVDKVISSYNELVHSINALNAQILEEKHKSLQLQLDNVIYELRSLYSQINKHFLINVLSSIRSLVNLKEEEKAKYCIENLSEFLRYSLTIETSSTIEKEVYAAKSYLNIQYVRYPLVTFDFDIDERLNNIVVPRVLLQPLLENCFVHGLIDKKGKIFVKIYKDNNYVIIDVLNQNQSRLTENDMLEINKKIITDKEEFNDSYKKHGLALKNIQKRLKLIYGDCASVSLLLSENGDFVITRVIIPKEGK